MAVNLIKIESEDGTLSAPLIDASLPDKTLGTHAMALFVRYEKIRYTPRHLAITGWQDSGAKVEARFGPDDMLILIDSDDRVLPQPIIEALLPQTARDTDIIAQFGMIEGIRAEHGHLAVEGEDAYGQDMRAAFEEARTVLQFGRDDDGHDGHCHDSGLRGDGPRGSGPRGNIPLRRSSIPRLPTSV